MADDATSLYSFDGPSDIAASSTSTTKSPIRDSFSELTLLMRAKKPYAFDGKSTRRRPPPQLPTTAAAASTTAPAVSVTTARKESASSNHAVQKSVTVPETVTEFLQQQELCATSASEVDLARRFHPKKIIQTYNTANTAVIRKSYEFVKLEKPAPQSDESKLAKDQQAIKELGQKSADSEVKLKELKYLQDTIKNLTRERNEAVQASVNASASAQYRESRSKDLANTIAQQEKNMTELRQELVEANLKNADLEDDILNLKQLSKSNETELEDLKAKVRQKMVECDRQQHQLKTVEAQLWHCQDRLQDITRNGMSLQGAVHLVKPNAQAQLPKGVIACSECYANNLTCDGKTTCRNCAERDKSCARWRCSLKHKLGHCPFTPCKFPHDSQGWLVLCEERPEW